MSVDNIGSAGNAAQIAKLMAQAEAMGNAEEAAVATAEVAPILRGTNVNVTTATGGTQGAGGVGRDAGSLPALDMPSNHMVGPADLEELLAYLTIDNEKVQAEQAKERIEQLLGEMNKTHEEALAGIKDALEQSEKLAEEQKKSKILGWIMTAISAIAAIALSVVTMGAATGPAIAGLVLTCASVALSITTQALNEAGVIEDFIEEQAQKKVDEAHAEGKKLSLEEAKAQVSGTFNAIMTAVQAALALGAIGCSIGSIVKGGAQATTKAVEKGVEEAGKQAAKEAAKAVEETAKKGVMETLKNFAKNAKVQLAMKITQMVTSTLGLAGGVASTVMAFDQAEMNKELADKQAALKEIEKLLEQIEQAAEEEEETLQDLLTMIQDNMGLLAEMIGQSCDASNRISINIAQSGV